MRHAKDHARIKRIMAMMEKKPPEDAPPPPLDLEGDEEPIDESTEGDSVQSDEATHGTEQHGRLFGKPNAIHIHIALGKKHGS